MKSKYGFAALLTALLLMPILTALAGNAPAFTIDQRRILQGMNRSWLQGYEPTITYNTLSLVLPVQSEQAEGQIETELLLPDEASSPFKPQTMSVRTWASEGGLYAVRLNLELYADRRNGDYACTIRITGKSRDGASLVTSIPYTLRIRDGLPTAEVPRMNITGLEAELNVGEDGWIRAMLTNPCKTVTFEQPVLHITDTSGDILPRDADVLYLPDLAPGESTQVDYPVTVLAKAAVAPHSLKFDLTWTALGEHVTQSEGHTLPVRQEMRLEQGGLKMASSVVAGDSVSLSLPLMNMGRAEIINVLVTIRLPGITDRQSVLVGTIAPGETRQAQLTLSPGRDLSGDFTGTLTVTGTDDDGNSTTLELPLRLTVEAAPQTTAAPDTASTAEEKPPLLTLALAGGCGLLALLLLLQGLLLRRKLHRLEEEQL